MIREAFPFDESSLDKLFESDTDKFRGVLLAEAKELYKSRETSFTPEIMRKVERDIYLQILDNLWMQHLENMDHLREGIHWISVGQRDPLVEYRRQGQILFDDMLIALRHDVVRALFHAEPVAEVEAPVETDITRAANRSVSNAGQIIENQEEFEEKDFVPKKAEQQIKKVSESKRKKAHKAERQRKAKARRRK
jgi:preprotein translocase subunit SecA